MGFKKKNEFMHAYSYKYKEEKSKYVCVADVYVDTSVLLLHSVSSSAIHGSLLQKTSQPSFLKGLGDSSPAPIEYLQFSTNFIPEHGALRG